MGGGPSLCERQEVIAVVGLNEKKGDYWIRRALQVHDPAFEVGKLIVI